MHLDAKPRFTEFDKQLKIRGWTYDVGDEVFRERKRVLDGKELIALLPGMTPDELASYQDDRYDKWRKARK